MKKLLLLLSPFIFLVVSNCYGASLIGSGITSSCTSYDSADASGSGSYNYISRYDSTRYCGLQVAENKTVCAVSFWAWTTDGDISGKTFTAYIYALSSNTFTPASPLATSTNTISGSTVTSSDTELAFTFSPTAVTAGNHCIVISMDETDGTNFAKIHYNTTDTDDGFGAYGIWSNIGARITYYSDRDIYYEVSTQ